MAAVALGETEWLLHQAADFGVQDTLCSQLGI